VRVRETCELGCGLGSFKGAGKGNVEIKGRLRVRVRGTSK
jgi:hypothetical protein